VGGLSLCATRAYVLRCQSREYGCLGLSIDLQVPSGGEGEEQRCVMPDSTSPLSIDSSRSFDLVELLPEESSHQALE